jgi:hypothetical protein
MKEKTHSDFDFYTIDIKRMLDADGIEIDLDDANVEEALMSEFERGTPEEYVAVSWREKSIGTIRIQTDPNISYIKGRNGTFDLPSIIVQHLSDTVMIDGVGKRGSVINGGLRISTEAMDNLARRWTEYRERTC